MSIEIDMVGKVCTYSVAGDLDALRVQEIRGDADQAANEAVSLHIFNGQELTAIDSSGIGFVVYLFKKVKAQGMQFALAGFAGQPMDMMRFLKLDQVIPTYPNVDAAKESFERRGQV